jgi:DNA-binding MarR family transcriptional regulator
MHGTELSDQDYETLAAFRHALRRFTAFSEAAARAQGLTPQQHQALLAIRGAATGAPLASGELAAHLLVRHNTAVELVDRLVTAGLVARHHDPNDRRRHLVTLTAQAERLLRDLSEAHLRELRAIRPVLQSLLHRL